MSKRKQLEAQNEIIRELGRIMREDAETIARVRALREQSDSLADFIDTIAFMTSFEELKAEIEK